MNTLSKFALSSALAVAASFSMQTTASAAVPLVKSMFAPQEQWLCAFESGYGEQFNRVVLASSLPEAIEKAQKTLNGGERLLACARRKR